MKNKSHSFNIDTSLEQSPTLTMGNNTKANYHQLLRVLKRLTVDREIDYKFCKDLFVNFSRWKKEIQSEDIDIKELLPRDEGKMVQLLGFSERDMASNFSIANGTTILSVYEGTPYKQRRIYIGTMNKEVRLPSGQKMTRIILITKEVAIFLNWLVKNFPINEVIDVSWKSIYRGRTDLTYFGVVSHFISNKLDKVSAQYHKIPLDEVFDKFYLDYMVSYSGVMQKRVDEEMRSEGVATAYITKKNIPDEIKEHMDKTELLKLFDFVEFDEDVDLKGIKQFEEDVLFFENEPLFNHNVSSLRIRKLGKHSSQHRITSGLYYPSLDNISLDLRTLSSFVHEWGHAVDSHFGRLSATDKVFRDTIHPHVVKALHKNTKLKAKEIHYYSMPSEVFARGFEWYINDKYKPVGNSSLKTNEEYKKEGQYIVYDKIGDIIREFFKGLEDLIGVDVA